MTTTLAVGPAPPCRHLPGVSRFDETALGHGVLGSDDGGTDQLRVIRGRPALQVPGVPGGFVTEHLGQRRVRIVELPGCRGVLDRRTDGGMGERAHTIDDRHETGALGLRQVGERQRAALQRLSQAVGVEAVEAGEEQRQPPPIVERFEPAPVEPFDRRAKRQERRQALGPATLGIGELGRDLGEGEREPAACFTTRSATPALISGQLARSSRRALAASSGSMARVLPSPAMAALSVSRSSRGSVSTSRSGRTPNSTHTHRIGVESSLDNVVQRLRSGD